MEAMSKEAAAEYGSRMACGESIGFLSVHLKKNWICSICQICAGFFLQNLKSYLFKRPARCKVSPIEALRGLLIQSVSNSKNSRGIWCIYVS
jgi:hypothetical protein